MKKIVLVLSICFVLVFASCQSCNNDKQFFVGSRILNRIRFKLFSDELQKFNNKLESSNYLSLKIETTQNGMKTNTDIRARKNPIYLEQTTGNEIQIITQENDNVFLYTPIENTFYDRKYLGKASKYDILKELNQNEIFSQKSVEIDINKCSIKHKKNQFIIKCLVKNILNSDTKDMLRNLLISSDISIDRFYNSVLTMTYTFIDNQLIMDLSMDLDIEEDKEPISVNVTLTINLQDFIVTSMLDKDYTYTLPNNFEEVYQTYNFGDTINLDYADKICLKVNVEKGMIVTDFKNIELSLYDMNKKIVSECVGGFGRSSYNILDSFLPVYEPGTYYLIVQGNISGHDTMKFDFYPYETVVYSKPINLAYISSFETTIEGKYDFEKLVYNNYEPYNHTLRITNNGDETIFFLKEDRYGFNDFYSVEPREVCTFPLENGKTQIYICQKFDTNEELSSYLCKCQFEILPFSVSEKQEVENIPHAFEVEDYSYVLYYTELEKGVYSFLSDPWEKSTQDVIIYDAYGRYLDTSPIESCDFVETYFASHFVIPETGFYYIFVMNECPMTETIYFKKYDFENIPDKSNPIPFIISDTNSNTGILEGIHDFEYYSVENTTNQEQVYCITNESDMNLGFIIKDEWGDLFYEYYIAAGEKLYFIVYPGITTIPLIPYHSTDDEDQVFNYRFKVVEIKNPNSSDMKYENLKIITEEFSDDYYLMGEDIRTTYMKVNLKEKGYICFEYEKCYSRFNFDSERVEVRIFNSEGQKCDIKDILEPGEYVVSFRNTTYISHVKIKYTFTPEKSD